MICKINKERFNDFMSSLTIREDNYPTEINGYEVHFFTIQLDGNSFSGTNGIWEEFMNVAFRTNDPSSIRKEIKLIKTGD